MPDDSLAVLTQDWFLARASLGVATGYLLRVLEHIVWSLKASREQNPLGNALFALMVLPQSLVFGFAFGYLLLAIVAHLISSQTVVEMCSYGLPALMSFLAVDLRDLIRRISRM